MHCGLLPETAAGVDPSAPRLHVVGVLNKNPSEARFVVMEPYRGVAPEKEAAVFFFLRPTAAAAASCSAPKRLGSNGQSLIITADDSDLQSDCLPDINPSQS